MRDRFTTFDPEYLLVLPFVLIFYALKGIFWLIALGIVLFGFLGVVGATIQHIYFMVMVPIEIGKFLVCKSYCWALPDSEYCITCSK